MSKAIAIEVSFNSVSVTSTTPIIRCGGPGGPGGPSCPGGPVGPEDPVGP